MNDTMIAFGYPGALIHAYERWVALLRPKQVTLGSLVLVCTEPVKTFSRISREAFAELKAITEDVERALSAEFSYDKINYLMLMMVDPDVHFHVFPRYSDTRVFDGTQFHDGAWPGPPNLQACNEVNESLREALIERLRWAW